MNFYVFLRHTVIGWVLGPSAGAAAHRALGNWFDGFYLFSLRTCLNKQAIDRALAQSLWERIQSGAGLVDGDLWVAANLPRKRGSKMGQETDIPLQALVSRWQEVEGIWPQPEQDIIKCADPSLQGALKELCLRLPYELGVILGGLRGDTISELLPLSLREDIQLQGNFHRRALMVAAWLGDDNASLLEQPSLAKPTQLLLDAHRERNVEAERRAISVLLGVQRQLNNVGAMQALTSQALVTAIKSGAGEGAAVVLDGLSEDALRCGKKKEALSYQMLRAEVAELIPTQLKALRQGGELAKALGEFEEAVILLRREVALQESVGDLKGAGNAWLLVGHILLGSGRPEEAILAASEAVERLVEAAAVAATSEAVALRGEAKLKSGRKQEGQRDLRQALALTHDESLIQHIRGVLRG